MWKTTIKKFDILEIGCFTYLMRSYSQIFTDFCNTTRLRFRTFWHGLKWKIEERKRQEEEQLKRFAQSFIDRLFK